MSDLRTSLPDTPEEQLPNPEYETQDKRIDRRSFLARSALIGAGAVAMTQLPPIGVRPAQAAGSSSAYATTVRPEVLDDPTEATVSEAATLIKSGQLKPSELTEAYLQRIAKFDADYWQAYLLVLADESRAAAAALDTARYKGPLHGISVPVKDNFYTKDILTTAQSMVFADFVPDVDATAVRLLKKSGAIILGKLAMGPLAGGRPRDPATGIATTRNAWSPNDPGPSPSGSSGGSGCVTAARMATCSLGTQTGGSINGPGNANGLVGFKPTHGRCSVFGVIPLTITRDHIGPLARDAKDAAIVLEAISGRSSDDLRTLGMPKVPDLVGAATPVIKKGRVLPRFRLKVGIPAGYAAGTTPTALARQNLLNVLANLGYEIVEVSFPEEYTLLNGGGFGMSGAEHEPDFAFVKKDVRLFGDRLTGWISSFFIDSQTMAKGLRCRLRAIELAYSEFWPQCDVVFANTGFDALGFPLSTFQIGFAPNTQGIVLPITATVGGPSFGEENMLSLIAAFQAVTDFHLKRPPDPIIGVAKASDPRTPRVRMNAKLVDADIAATMLA